MDTKKIEEMSAKYKQQLDALDTEGLKLLVEDRLRAEEYARKGIEAVEPENLNDEYVQTVANEMQVIAKMILEERAKGKSDLN